MKGSDKFPLVCRRFVAVKEMFDCVSMRLIILKKT